MHIENICNSQYIRNIIMKKFLKIAFGPSLLLTIVVLIISEQHAWAYFFISVGVLILLYLLIKNSNEKHYEHKLQECEKYVCEIEKIVDRATDTRKTIYSFSDDSLSIIDKRLEEIEKALNHISEIDVSLTRHLDTYIKASERNPVFMSKDTVSEYIRTMDKMLFASGINTVQRILPPCEVKCNVRSLRHHKTYKTTLTSCDCSEFKKKEPCKHMIALALAVGALLPVSDCNINFNGAGLSDEVDHLNATRRALTSEIELLNKQLEKAKNDLNEITEKIASAKKEHTAALSSLAHVKDLLNQVVDRDQVLIKDDLMKKYNERFPDDRFERGVNISKNTSMIKERIINCNIKCEMPSASIPNKYYYTTLKNCTCKSYICNNKEGLPCKHMIALAIATKAIQPANTERSTPCPTAYT